jgi:hypothetical protein
MAYATLHLNIILLFFFNYLANLIKVIFYIVIYEVFYLIFLITCTLCLCNMKYCAIHEKNVCIQ